MKNTCFAFAIFLAGTPALLRADFTYQETTQMTGGSLMTMMKALGPFTRSAREPVVSTHIVKGNRMATITKDRVSVIDLDKETITSIETARKTYTVMTFAQMKQAMEDAANRAKSQPDKPGTAAANGNNDKANDDVKAQFKVSAKATGQTKTVQGPNGKEMTAKEMVLTMTMEGTNTKTGDSGNMDMVTDGWYAPIPGYDEVKEFNKRMAAKLSYAFGSSMQQIVQSMAAQSGQNGNVSGSMEELSKQMAKMDGVPVETRMTMGGTATPGASSDSASNASAPPPPPQQQPQQQSASSAIAGAALGRFGLGRKRKDDSQPPPQSSSSGASASSNGSASGTLMEMTTTLTSFSSGPADTSQFEVPAGFKQVEPGARRGR